MQHLPTGFFERKSINMNNESRLFVGNLSYQTMENDLQEHFSQAGVVTSVNLMLDKFTGKSRGFAFIEFSSAEEANKAVEMFHGKDLQGRALTVNIARPKEDRPPPHGRRRRRRLSRQSRRRWPAGTLLNQTEANCFRNPVAGQEN